MLSFIAAGSILKALTQSRLDLSKREINCSQGAKSLGPQGVVADAYLVVITLALVVGHSTLWQRATCWDYEKSPPRLISTGFLVVLRDYAGSRSCFSSTSDVLVSLVFSLLQLTEKNLQPRVRQISLHVQLACFAVKRHACWVVRVVSREVQITFIKIDTRWNEMHDDPRFQNLIQALLGFK